MMDLSKQLSETNGRLERALNELQIVYQLADNMYGALMSYQNEIDIDISPRLSAAKDYYDWVHAGEIVPEDINEY